MNSYEYAVETHALSKKFGEFTAVNLVDFYIKKGEIFGLLGPNGAGKTTLIRMLCAIMKPSSGQANVLGWDIAKNPDEIKRNIGYMTQRFSLYNDLTAVENIAFYASVYEVSAGMRKSRIEELIQMAGLAGFEHVQARNLSGAWRQRLALACAIVHRPPMLFLDEATAGVDPISRREFWDLIYSMAGEGISVLATTHYMDEADYCNKIGLILDGKIIRIASPDTLKESLGGALLQIECGQTLSAEGALKDSPGVLDVSIHGALLHVLLMNKSWKQKIIHYLGSKDIHVISSDFILPSLEDVFIKTVDETRKKNQFTEISENSNG